MKAGEDPGAEFCNEIERAACSVESVEEEEEGEEDDWYKVVRAGERLERQARRAQYPSERVELLRQACKQYEDVLSCAPRTHARHAEALDFLESALHELGGLLKATKDVAGAKIVNDAQQRRRKELINLCAEAGVTAPLPTHEDGWLVCWQGRGKELGQVPAQKRRRPAVADGAENVRPGEELKSGHGGRAAEAKVAAATAGAAAAWDEEDSAADGCDEVAEEREAARASPAAGGDARTASRFARRLEVLVEVHGFEWSFYVPHPTSLQAMLAEGTVGHGTVGWLTARVAERLVDECSVLLCPEPPPGLYLHGEAHGPHANDTPQANEQPAPAGDQPPPAAGRQSPPASEAQHPPADQWDEQPPLASSTELWSLVAPLAPPMLLLRLRARTRCARQPYGIYEAQCTAAKLTASHKVLAQLSQLQLSPAAAGAPTGHALELNSLGLSEDASLRVLLKSLGSISSELRSLSLTHGAVEASHLAELTALIPARSPLLTLDLAAQQLSPVALTHLIAAGARGACPHLTSLRLDSNPCADAFAEALPLGGTPEAVARLVGELPLARGGWQLRTLRLASTFLGELGFAALSTAVAHAPALVELDVSRNEPPFGAGGEGTPMRRLCSAWIESGKEEVGLVM